MIETITPDWPAPARINACCTTRRGGVSAQPFDSLNLALHVGDREADVMKNRQLLRAQLAFPDEPEWINQTHSAEVVTLEDDSSRDADAAITREPGRVAVVMTADCLPILLCNRDATEVAALHAGWRGLQAGIVQSTLSAMQSPRAQLLAWIGPGISQASFEVGDEVYAAFVDADNTLAACFSANRPGHWLCDLAGIAAALMYGLGVEQVACSSHCSFRDAGLFYSYRRETVTGRMASMIWIS